jgi:RNA polymerase sigma-70 factor (ECF subfamily)
MAILSFLFHSRQWRDSLEAARPALYRVAYAWCRDAALADDLVQEATTKALERGDQLRDPTRLKGWLFSILSRCWHDHLRSRHPHEDIDELADEYLAGGPTPPEEAERRQTVARVRAAVARLPIGQRQVLTLDRPRRVRLCRGRRNPRHTHGHGDEPPVSRAAAPCARTCCASIPPRRCGG